ncbi:tRNA (adenosine(37)-N6)-threonylcarbamoyltransferase complex ATPase subunit type 1 TsaE [Alcaligenes faecalis]|uniref:tRNA (adenosine(37)-N6)-threonylcarbamoyltransferase complex ATPase subunit type 1 TsaE n=1 Tax=Alcaligenes faecalis TaxID=511 RepID=UPI0012936F1E|nr:tRNA (adenosine(37)-N6)-threonylcarbamoyltransferase complex ATPase subunit type 1 TsaE [Alcaligenes faecalis]QFY76953.1 tRNA (adenosine(37)-N6)-threonylcarbamoyltransferase complex ATPase subunit type 1 TsaE [Alcaligenes faecalis]
MNPQALTLSLPDEDATTALAERLAPLLGGQVSGVPAGGRIHLHGDLGAGKTHFVRALLRACGVTGRIKSPSYALLESYKVSSLYFYHLDFYRFSDPREWVDAGFRDILQDNAVVLIEWPEKAGDLLPEPDLDLHLDYCGDGRLATLDARSAKGTLWITTLAPSQQK